MNLHVKLEGLRLRECLVALHALELGGLHMRVLVTRQLGLIGSFEPTDLAYVAFGLFGHFVSRRRRRGFPACLSKII